MPAPGTFLRQQQLPGVGGNEAFAQSRGAAGARWAATDGAGLSDAAAHDDWGSSQSLPLRPVHGSERGLPLAPSLRRAAGSASLRSSTSSLAAVGQARRLSALAQHGAPWPRETDSRPSYARHSRADLFLYSSASLPQGPPFLWSDAASASIQDPAYDTDDADQQADAAEARPGPCKLGSDPKSYITYLLSLTPDQRRAALAVPVHKVGTPKICVITVIASQGFCLCMRVHLNT